jgi:two-component system alkaline phosphatase synthesis response regulator PhoP
MGHIFLNWAAQKISGNIANGMDKILVVEDDENIRELVVYALNSNGFEAIGFEKGGDFFSHLKISLPRLILLDVMLPEENGINILKKLKREDATQKIPVIMLTAKSGEYDKVKGLDLGADDYITKPFSILELIARIKAVLRRSAAKETDEVLAWANISLDVKKRKIKVDEKTITLTYKEFELLQYLLRNQGMVLSRDKIIEQIWGFEFEGESRTIDMHIKTLRQKLGGAGALIETVRGIGYKLGE